MKMRHLCAGLTLTGLTALGDVAQAVPIRQMPDLVSLTFWERTGGSAPNPFTFGANSPEITTRRSDPLSLTNRDFVGTPVEFYDVFYSNADGSFNLDGEFISVEADFPFTLPAGGGLNLAEIQINFANAPIKFGSFVASFVALGDNAIPGHVGRAVDGDLLTHTTMGNTLGQEQRLRVTVGFEASVPVPEPAPTLFLWSGLLLLGGLRKLTAPAVKGN